MLSIEELLQKRAAADEIRKIETISDRKRGNKRCRRLYKRLVYTLFTFLVRLLAIIWVDLLVDLLFAIQFCKFWCFAHTILVQCYHNTVNFNVYSLLIFVFDRWQSI